VDWQDDDFRFVQKDGNVYAFIMKGDHTKTAVIKSFKPEETVSAVEVSGCGTGRVCAAFWSPRYRSSRQKGYTYAGGFKNIQELKRNEIKLLPKTTLFDIVLGRWLTDL
jgi:hypothetical protein